MKNLLLKTVKDFIGSHWKEGKPVLLALSGGVDSSSLFSLLLECRHFFPLDLCVVHFDHAWREESFEEALLLKEFVSRFEIPFYMERSSQSSFESGNLEEKARNERYSFFQKIYKQTGAQALLLAHQREDQAETVLKRLFEGAGVLSLGGMQESSFFEEMVLWRPLLSVSREKIEEWNQGELWVPFKDRTNLDLKFLRPRMRELLFPELEKQFGKSVRHSLFRIGEEFSLLKDSMRRRLSPYLEKRVDGKFGSALSVMDFDLLDSFERQELVRLFLQTLQITLNSSTLKLLVALLEKRVSCKQVDVQKGVLLVERGGLVWIDCLLPNFQGLVPLEKEGSYLRQKEWSWEFRKEPLQDREEEKSFLSCFLDGAISYCIPDATGLVLSSYDELEEKDQKKVSSCLSKNKIPAKLKRMFPVIIKDGSLIESCFHFENNLIPEGSFVFSSIILKM